MINVIKYEDLGGADHGWLKAKHHFSFASYQDPNRVRFGPMRVINDDIVLQKKVLTHILMIIWKLLLMLEKEQ